MECWHQFIPFFASSFDGGFGLASLLFTPLIFGILLPFPSRWVWVFGDKRHILNFYSAPSNFWIP